MRHTSLSCGCDKMGGREDFLRGVEYGKVAKISIRENIEQVLKHAEEKGISRRELVSKALEKESILKERIPEIMDELKGMAVGAEVPYIDVLILNIWGPKFFGAQ